MMKNISTNRATNGSQLRPWLTLALVFIGLTLLAQASQGADKAAQYKAIERSLRNSPVTNMFYDTPLRDALMDMSTQTGVTIVTDLSVQGLVTCDLKEVPLGKALNIVLASGNFVYRNMGDYILVGSTDPKSPAFLKLSDSKTVMLNYQKPSEAVKGLYESLRAFATANDEAKAVTVTAPEPLLSQIVNSLKAIDQPPAQIMLEARVVVMEIGDLLNLGVNWEWPEIRAGTYENDQEHRWPWGIQVGYTPGREFSFNLALTLNLLEQNSEAMILSDTRVMAQDGKESEIKVTTEEYFEIISSGYYTQSDLKAIEVGTILTITPTITQDGLITLQMKTEVSDVVARGENNLPVVTRRQAMSTVRLEDEGTAVVGGLIDNRSTNSLSDVPGMSKVPILGHIFRDTATKSSQKQVAIFITPKMIGREDSAMTGRTSATKHKITPVGDEFRVALQESIRRLDMAGTRLEN